MSRLEYLKKFDISQFWRLFVDGRFQKKYNGWVGYEAGERGSVQALINGFEYMVDNFDISNGLKATYLRELHKICMLGVETSNKKSSPGDIRYLNSGMPFFAKSTTYEHLVEVFAMRMGDGTAIFNSQKWGKPADQLDVNEIYQVMKKDKKINYRNWYPNLDITQIEALEGKKTLKEFYDAKHTVQMLIIDKMEDIIARYNRDIKKAKTDDEKLKVISLVPRELELLHPFPDGNSRTFSCITLTHLLLYNGFAPALLENPNLDNEVSHSQWIKEVKKGIQRTKELIQNPTMKLFNYSILDMAQKDRDRFTAMCKNLKIKIDNYKEIYLTPKRLEEYTNGTWIDGVDENLRFTGVGTYGTYSNGNIYFAMAIKDWIDEKKDVEYELKKVLSKGMRAIVLDDMRYFHLVNIPILYVKDCFEAFKSSAINVRQDHDPYTVLVTGTEGKTGSKVQFHHILNKQIKTHAVLNSANTEIPVLRSLINLETDDKVEINEVSVGSNEAYRVERAKMVNPNLCFVTNIGPNHMDMHKTIDNIMDAKSSVVEGLREGGKCIVNSTIEHFDKLLKALYNRKKDLDILSYGRSKDDTAYLIDQVFHSEKFGWDVKANIDGVDVEYFIPLFQNHAPLTSVGILLAVKTMGYDVAKAAKDYEGLVPFETMGRILKIQKRSGIVHFYDQSRRGGIHGMRSAFADMENFKIKGKIVALIGGISTKKDSQWTKESHEELAKMINSSNIDRLYTTGNYMNYTHDKLENKNILVEHSDDLDHLAQVLYDDVEGGDLLFIIGNAYLYLGRVSNKILKLKEGSLDLDTRAKLLYNFFGEIDNILLEDKNLKNVNNDIVKNSQESYVYNETYCKRWFNNLDKIDGIPKKQLFGSFYHFGDKDYLLHIEVATTNLHIGFVKYIVKDGSCKAIKMSSDDRDILEKRYKDILNFEYRTWGLGWYSYDYGTIIDFSKPSVYNMVTNLANSDLIIDIIKPLSKKIISYK